MTPPHIAAARGLRTLGVGGTEGGVSGAQEGLWSPDTSWTHSEPVWWGGGDTGNVAAAGDTAQGRGREEKYPGFSLPPPGSYHCGPLAGLI